MKLKRTLFALLWAGAVVGAGCVPADQARATAGRGAAALPAATEAAPAIESQEPCLTEEALSAGQVEPAQLRGLDRVCLKLLSEEIVYVNQAEAVAEIRAFARTPDLELTLRGVGSELNAPQPLRVAVFQDGAGSEYRVDMGAGRVVMAHLLPTEAASAALTLDELRARAEQRIGENTPEFAELAPSLTYEEGSKGEMHFFRWEDRTYAGPHSMFPMAQVGMAEDGRLVTYINSLFVSVP